MKINRFTLVSVFVAAFAILMVFAFAGTPATPPQSKPAAMQKWEYCAVTEVNRRPSSVQGTAGPMAATIVYFLETGEKRETLEVQDGKNYDSLAKAFATLGQDGWELVFQGAENLGGGSYTKAIYFKRPKI